MAVIKENFGEGGANMTPNDSAGDPSLAVVLLEIADDVEGLQPAAIVAADAADLGSAITLVNEIKAKFNSTANYAVKTVRG
jgi:hypothetical protein